MIRKDLIVAVLATFCLTATLFMVVPTRSASTQSDGLQYDPWKDINDDGKLDILDVVQITSQYGAQGTPINKTQMLLDLQNRVKVLEEKQDSMKTIRYFTPNETMNDKVDYKDAAVFVWNPRNATNNAIMSGSVYFQYNTTWTHGCTMKVLINDVTVANFGIYKYNTGYEQSQMWVLTTTNSIMPNQSSYTVKFQISADLPIGNQSYVKDINILLEVMDGLPPS